MIKDAYVASYVHTSSLVVLVGMLTESFCFYCGHGGHNMCTLVNTWQAQYKPKTTLASIWRVIIASSKSARLSTHAFA